MLPTSNNTSAAYAGMVSVGLNGKASLTAALTDLKSALSSKVSAVAPGDPKTMLEANVAMQEYEMMHSFIGSVFKTMADTFDRIAQKM